MNNLLKTTIFTIALALLLSASSAFAATPLKVATIDVNKVVKDHPISEKWAGELLSLKAKREEEIRQEFKKKYNVTDETELTREQQMQAQEFLVEANKRFTNEIMAEETKRLQAVEDDIFKYAKVIAQKRGIDLVLDRSAIIFGDTEDITDELLKMTKAKK